MRWRTRSACRCGCFPRPSWRRRRTGSPIRPRWCSPRPAAMASPRARRWRRSGRRARWWSPRPSPSARPARSHARPRRSIPTGSAARRAGSRSSASGPARPAGARRRPQALLDDAEDWVGYRGYLDLLERPHGQGAARLRARRGGDAGAKRLSILPRRAGGSRWSARAMPGSMPWRRWSSSWSSGADRRRGRRSRSRSAPASRRCRRRPRAPARRSATTSARSRCPTC